MPDWIFDKKDLKSSPSSRDGMDYETECRYRKEGARFISDIGSDLNLKHDTVATGCVYFHRFFMFHSFRDFNRYVASLGCLFLAGKVEETPKKCRDIIRAARQRLNDEQFAAFGEDPREELMTVERVLLQTIKFDLQVEHPYQYLLKYAKVLKGDPEKLQKMVQMAWTFINDSFCTPLCLQWEPEIIAIALMYLASRLSKFNIDDWQGRNSLKVNSKWWDQFVEDMSMDLLEEICHQVLDLYANTSGKDKSKANYQAVSSSGFQDGRPSASSIASTPSPNASSKTPTTTSALTPNPITSAPIFPTALTPSAVTASRLPSQPYPVASSSDSAPTTPAIVAHPVMPLPPPPPTLAQQPPSYAYPVQFAPQMPPGTVAAQPNMPYPPGLPVYATYNAPPIYAVPPPSAGSAAMPPAQPSYAMLAPPHMDFRSVPGKSQAPQPTYGAPSSIPHAYATLQPPPPPPPGLNMSQPPPGYGAAPPPPPQHRMHRRL